MRFLVFAEHHEGEFVKNSLGVLSKAASLGEADAVVVGADAQLAGRLGKHGAKVVHVASGDDTLDPPLPQPRVDVIAKLAPDYDAVLLGQSVLAADIAGGLAARLDAGLNWDLVDVEVRDGELVGKRPALQDSVYADVGWKVLPESRSSAPVRSTRRSPAATRRRAKCRPISRTIRPGSRWSSRRTPRSRAAPRSRTPT